MAGDVTITVPMGALRAELGGVAADPRAAELREQRRVLLEEHLPNAVADRATAIVAKLAELDHLILHPNDAEGALRAREQVGG